MVTVILSRFQVGGVDGAIYMKDIVVQLDESKEEGDISMLEGDTNQ